MSSNAFARSRPRVRHQRVPRTHSCDHPRFLQLVNELARINEAKKKQEEAQGRGCSGVEDIDDDTCGGAGDHSRSNIAGPCGTDSDNHVACCLGNGPQTSSSYRSSDNNQSTPALHDNYQQHQQNSQHHHHYHHQHHHHHHHHHSQHQADLQNLGNNSQHQDDRCHGKGSSTNFGYSKQNLVEHDNSDFSNNNSDLRQDENRSKRKRSANELLTNSRKNSSSCSASGSGKKHKSSHDAIRPLSPSFTKCPICLLDSMDRDPSFTNTCFHLFCYVCIENWTKNKATCPLCRTKFTKIIYNIKSATNYEEKIASPVRRDDDEAYISERFMLEHLSSLNPSQTVSNRNGNHDDVQFLFENLRNPEAFAPQYFVTGVNHQIDPRQGESLHSFNTVTTSTSFNSNVPHPPYTPTYPIAPDYIALFPQNRMAPTSSAAITSAYTVTNNLTNMNNDSGGRRISRSGRFVYTNRNYEAPNVDGAARVSRVSNTIINQPVVPHQNHHQHHHQQSHQHRSTLDITISPRQSQRMDQSHAHIALPYQIQHRHYNPNAYPRRPYNNPQVEHTLLNTLYRQMPDS